MPYQGFQDGLYLVAQWCPEKGVDHYGILDIGNRIRHPQVDARHPVVIHQRPPEIAIDWFQNTGAWRVLGKVTDEAFAIQRMRAAFENPAYDLFGHNCEHFARFVATGIRESRQLQSVGVVAGLAVLSIFASRQ
ncbi:MAG: hypothetical protein AMXMBFR72_32170 [Betaproteobacteria bacterium]